MLTKTARNFARFLKYGGLLVPGVILFSCGPSGSPQSDLARSGSNSAEVFSRKKSCAELGRIALSEEFKEDDHKDAFPRVSTEVVARWCYNERKDTCFYSGKRKTVIVDAVRVVELGSSWIVKDLLTNEKLLEISGKELEDPIVLRDFDNKFNEYFCKSDTDRAFILGN